jgi:glycosyltransferase involved in cell wall biosynthesis
VVPEADAEHAELVLLAAKILRAQGVDARLVTYTGRSSAAGLADTARAAEVPIETLDWTDEWLATTSAGSVVVLPATREAFGDTLVEAASFGIPSVAVSHAFGVADALVPGVSGQFAFTGTPEALAQAVLAARRMPRPDAAGWTARFSPDESGRLLLATLHRAAGLATPVPTPTP